MREPAGVVTREPETSQIRDEDLSVLVLRVQVDVTVWTSPSTDSEVDRQAAEEPDWTTEPFG